MLFRYHYTKTRLFFLLIVLLACWCVGYPQNHTIQFDRIGTAEGLSQSHVLCILKDSRGFMWFGTRDGLNKYDGYKFTVYKKDINDEKSLSNNYVTDIVESKNGDLWIATMGGGFCRYDRNKERFTRYLSDPLKTNSLCHNTIRKLMEDADQKLWIATEAGLDVFDPVKNNFEHLAGKLIDEKSPGDPHIRSVFKDSKQNIWVCTASGGVNLFNRDSQTFTRFKHDNNDNKTIAGDDVYTMFEDSKHRLWIGTGAGLDLFDRQSGVFTHYKKDDNNANSLSANVVYAINEDAENNLWIGTENGGLSIFNYNKGLFTTKKNDEIDQSSISNNSIYSIYRDSKNNMWVGTFAGDVCLANRDKMKVNHYKHMMQKNSLSNNAVLSILEDSKKNIWIGTDGGGLNLFDPKLGGFTHFRHDKNNKKSICGNYVLTVCEDSKGNIWIGTWGDGITVFNAERNTYKHFKNNASDNSSLRTNNAWKIIEDSDKNIWIGTYGGGLELFNPGDNTFTHFQYDKHRSNGISHNNIISLFEDSDKDLWIGTDGGGLNRFNKKTKTFTTFVYTEGKNSISNNNLGSIHEDSDKNLWIGTRGGLNFYNKKTNRFTVYTTADGLPDNEIFGILEDDKRNLWISTNRGICYFNTLTKAVRNYDVSNGLQSNEFKLQAFFKSASGMMYFGGSKGFNEFYPGNIKATAFEAPLVISNIQILNKDVPIASDNDEAAILVKSITETQSITLPYSSSVLSLEFASLNYTAPAKKRYAYMLEGFDKTWIENGTVRIATYTNLDPGKYTFKVKGLNNEGNWSKNIKTLQVIITPPYWLTWWFRVLMFISIIAIVVAFYKYRMHSIEAQKSKLQQQVKEQTKQLLLSTQQEHEARQEADKARLETEIANKELKIKNKELEQFAYVASHDLQEPLRTTSGFVELLHQQYHGRLDEKADKYLDYISDASNRMKVLIKDLLDFSRIGARVELKKIDCNTMLRNMLADIMVAIQEAKADIQYTDLPVINGYPTEVKLLFQNLVINAIKFRKPGIPPRINISVEKAGTYWQFAIRDNGIGIAHQHSERIFDIFQRLHTRKEYAGSGIGLSHCKKIVELHHGKIWVESTPGQGSTFYFTLPESGMETSTLKTHDKKNVLQFTG